MPLVGEGTSQALCLAFWFDMNRYELKKPLALKEQVQKLKSHNFIIEDEVFAENVLSMVNYYRFSGYAIQFRKSENDSTLADKVSFNMVYRIYRFDENLRSILRKYIETLEILYRTRIAYWFSLNECISPPYDQHYNENNFYNKNGYKELQDHFKKEQKYYNESLVIKHHAKNYSNRFPLWVIVEMITFSDLSKLYSCMFNNDKITIADSVSLDKDTLANNLHCLSVLRNKCAHAARLYNTRFNPPIVISRTFLRRYKEVANDSLFAYILVLIKHLPEREAKGSALKEIEDLILEYKQDIDLKLIGFPDNWYNIIKWTAFN